MPAAKPKVSYWSIDEKKEKVAIFWVNFGPDNKEPIKIKVNHFEGRIYVDIRYYFYSTKEKLWKPKKAVVNFNMPDWDCFESMFGEVRVAVIEMKRLFCPDRAPLSAYRECKGTKATPPVDSDSEDEVLTSRCGGRNTQPIEESESEDDTPSPSDHKKSKIAGVDYE
jgi:hypothetical protein